MNLRKREKTKAKLLKAVRLIIVRGENASVTSITKKLTLRMALFIDISMT